MRLDIARDAAQLAFTALHLIRPAAAPSPFACRATGASCRLHGAGGKREGDGAGGAAVAATFMLNGKHHPLGPAPRRYFGRCVAGFAEPSGLPAFLRLRHRLDEQLVGVVRSRVAPACGHPIPRSLSVLERSPGK